MNKSAILFNKWEKELAQELPRYVTSSRRNSKLKTVNINKGLMSQGLRNKTIHKLLEASIKQALKGQDGKRAGKSKWAKDIGKPFPRPILNLLYRQNIKNYNPYVSALAQLEELKTNEG